MEPLAVLVGTFLIALVFTRLIKKRWEFGFPGRVGMSAMLLFTGVAHFMYPKGMELILPDFIPFKMTLVYSTGFIEIAAAIGLLIPKLQRITSWLLILFFLMVLPANIHAAINHINIRTGSYDGEGPEYLWFRIPLQIFFIAWVYYFGIRKRKSHLEQKPL